MPEYRRVYNPGATYFFTVVTQNRQALFEEAAPRTWLRRAFQEVRRERPFRLDAICLLPEHLHCLWTMPPDDGDFSRRWQEIKGRFSKQAIRSGRFGRRARTSRASKGEVEVWQRRFWEHRIRNEGDLRRHLDYIHFNPVKHGLVTRPMDWPWSSFRRFVSLGWYSEDWGEVEPSALRTLEVGE